VPSPSRPVRGLALALAFAASAMVAAGAAESKPRRDASARYVFAGVPWGTRADSALRLLEERGYRRIERRQGAANFTAEGDLFGRIGVVRGFTDDSNRVVRWTVRLVGEPGPRKYLVMRALYEDVLAETRARYGARKVGLDRYDFPFDKGDGREQQALAQGKAQIRSEWHARAGDLLVVELDPATDVQLVYESPEWRRMNAEARRRRAADF
jgi:hypothetical protein